MSESEKTTHEFQAAVTRVLSLVINSLYSNKDIFLRELISNASDALDKLRFRGITEPELLEGEPLHIRIIADETAGTLTVSDSGVGMSRDDLVQNLGTVAHSGSQDFIARLEEAAKTDVNLIGQFGVGFYSAYLVADRVEVLSRAAGETQAHRWSSDGKDTFVIESAERAGRGTDIVLHLKDEHRKYLSSFEIRQLVKRYSDYVDHPVELEVERKVPAEDGDDAAEPETTTSWERINEAGALWQRPKSEISDEEYVELYHHLTHDWTDPLAHRHFKIEGTQLFTGLLYVPSQPPFDLFSANSGHGVRLHVKRVFIMDECEELLPKWLRFVRGIIDSEDLPLNVSREMLQDSREVRTIRKQVIKHSLDMIEELASGDEGEEFWKKYGAVIKEGLHYDPDMKDRLAKVIRWQSSAGDALTTLPEYVERMKDGQSAIYFALGANPQAILNAPHLEVLKKRGYEVLLMTDPIDQFAVDGLGEFDGKRLVSAMDANLDIEPTEEEKKDAEDADEPAIGDLLTRFRAVLQDQVEEVRVSKRLTTSPVCLVLPPGGLPPHLERLLRARGDAAPKQKRILEVNPDHPLIGTLNTLVGREASADKVRTYIEVLYDQAILAEGSPIEDPTRLVGRLTDLLTDAAAAEAS